MSLRVFACVMMLVAYAMLVMRYACYAHDLIFVLLFLVLLSLTISTIQHENKRRQICDGLVTRSMCMYVCCTVLSQFKSSIMNACMLYKHVCM